MIGTAPNAADEIKASLTLGSVADKNDVTFTAILNGAEGNGVNVTFEAGSGPNVTTTVSVKAKQNIHVLLGTDASGVVSATASQVKAACVAHAAASLLVTTTQESDGSGVCDIQPNTFLSGGEYEAFPLNTPVLVNQRKHIAKAGTTGTLPLAFNGNVESANGALCGGAC